MSYTIFFQAHKQGEGQQIETEKIIACFEPFIMQKDKYGVAVEYDKLNSSFIYIDSDYETCDGFSVDRPCKDERLFMSLFEVAKLGNIICLFPEGNVHIFNQNTLEHLPDDMKLAFDKGDLTYEMIENLEDYLKKINDI